jgi:DNA repair protein RadC
MFHVKHGDFFARYDSGMCKILLEGQMSGKKWEDALSFKCTLVGEYI